MDVNWSPEGFRYISKLKKFSIMFNKLNIHIVALPLLLRLSLTNTLH